MCFFPSGVESEEQQSKPQNSTTILMAEPSNPAGRPGSGFEMTYRWNASPMDDDYTVYVHFVDDKGAIVMQDDHMPPVPTSEWKGNVEYTRTIPLEVWKPEDNKTIHIALPEGDYKIYAGLYDPEDGRLVLQTGPGVTTLDQDKYQIGTLTIDKEAPIPSPGKKTLDLSGYELTFNEEFDELRVSAWGPIGNNGSRWIAHTPWHGDFGDARFSDPKPGFPFTVSDGILRIEASQRDGEWQSGLLSLVDPQGNGFTQQYGYFECRAKFPKGPGTWPAFWLVGTKNLKQLPQNKGPRINPEIDIVEHYGHWPWRYSFAYHEWGFEGAESYHDETRILAFGTEEDFHTHGVMIDDAHIVLYYDGVEMLRMKTPEAAKTPLYPLINLALGPGWPLDQTPDPCYMYVDYVKIWREK
jgi:hypothetical protein